MRLRGILDNSSNAMFVKDMSGCYVLVNRCYESTLGLADDEIRGKTDDNLFPPEYSNVYKENEARVQAAGVPMQFEEQFLLQGQVHTRLANRFLLHDELERPKGICAICTDITERKSTEEALRRSEKLAAAGRLAASIAHEINNPLEALMNLVYLLQKQTELREQSRALLATAEQELNRVSHITRQTLAFYRESTVPTQLDLAGMIKSLIELYRNRIRHRELEIDFTSVGDCTVRSIEGEMRQAFSNLLANAIDASRNHGTVRVRLTSMRAMPGVTRPAGVRVTIADNGCGIPRENLRRIFEAFFTTKSDGTGTGLGLWVTKSILEKHKANLAIRSSATPGASGTVISVFVPEDSGASQQLEKDAQEAETAEASASECNQEGAAA
jgi:PAS domain S-box-containing protein